MNDEHTQIHRIRRTRHFAPGFVPWCLCTLWALTACSGGSTPAVPTRSGAPTAGGAPPAQQTAFARLTEVPAPSVVGAVAPAPINTLPALATAPGVNSATLAASNPAMSGTPLPSLSPPASPGGMPPPRPASVTAPVPATAPKPMQSVTPVSVTEAPPLGANGPMGGTMYTNPARTFRFVAPAGWSPPMPDASQPARVVTRAPGNAVTLTMEESTPPDNWPRLPAAVVAGTLDGEYRAANPSSVLGGTVLTGVRGQGDLGLSTYRFTYNASVNNAPAVVERFVVLTFSGAITITATGTPDAYNAAKPTVEAVVGSLIPLKQDAPTPASLAPVTGPPVSGGATKTPSDLGLMLPAGWVVAPVPKQPPGVEFLAQSADKTQVVRVVRKSLGEGMTLDDFASTTAGEFKAISQGYDVDDEGENTISGQRAVRVVYSAVVDGRPVEGQSVALVKGGVGYVITVEVPTTQYADHHDETQALFDRIESSVTLP